MHFPDLIRDLAVILGVAAVVAFIFRRIKQPLVLGYIVAGIIVGPYTPAFFSVQETESIKIWAEWGVIFLMFNLGAGLTSPSSDTVFEEGDVLWVVGERGNLKRLGKVFV